MLCDLLAVTVNYVQYCTAFVTLNVKFMKFSPAFLGDYGIKVNYCGCTRSTIVSFCIVAKRM